MGLAKVGVVPALINTNLRSDPLVHTITTAASRAVIYGMELEEGEAMLVVDVVLFTTLATWDGI